MMYSLPTFVAAEETTKKNENEFIFQLRKDIINETVFSVISLTVN